MNVCCYQTLFYPHSPKKLPPSPAPFLPTSKFCVNWTLEVGEGEEGREEGKARRAWQASLCKCTEHLLGVRHRSKTYICVNLPKGGGTTTYITIYYCYVYCKRGNQIIKQLSQVEPKSTCFYPRAKSQRNTKDFVFCLCRAFKILRLKTQSLYLLLLKSIGLS